MTSTICPECTAGKHAVCSNLAADSDGEPTTCSCACRLAFAARGRS